MTKEYSFFIPEIEFIKDLKGLLKYLGQKIVVGMCFLPFLAQLIGRTCIFCDKSLSSLEAVRSHMVRWSVLITFLPNRQRDMNHTMIRWDDNEKEYEDFYDWSNDTRFVVEEDEEGNILPEKYALVFITAPYVLARIFRKVTSWFSQTEKKLVIEPWRNITTNEPQLKFSLFQV